MSFADKLTAFLPFAKKEEVLEYFFAVNISNEKLIAALWQIEGKQLKILETASGTYSSLSELSKVTDKLLDSVLGIRDVDPQKILFGVPSTWLKDENLKEDSLKALRDLVKELELTPMAYVESANALIHLLEKTDGVPPTAILVGFEPHHLTVTVVRAGKLDGVKTVSRGDNSAADIEKALLVFTAVETLPSKILIYGDNAPELKNQLLSFPWMSKLSFLHFPKIDTLQDDIEIKSVCLAGASELESNVLYTDSAITEEKNSGIDQNPVKSSLLADEEEVDKEKLESNQQDFSGFVAGDISGQLQEEEPEDLVNPEEDFAEEKELPDPQETNLTVPEKFEEKPGKKLFTLNRFIPRKRGSFALLVIVFLGLLITFAAYVLLPKAEVKIFVEPKVVEKDTTVVADPNQKLVDEMAKIIPGQIVNTEVSDSLKDKATGSKLIGDPAKGTVIIYNKTNESKSISKGTTLTVSKGLKFTLDVSATIASQSAADSGITYGKSNATVTASAVGADGNLPSGSEFSVGSFSSNQVSAKAEGNFSGGTSKSVVVVSSDDQNRLLAELSSKLRKQAQQKLQETESDKKILEEALNEEIVKKTFSKNINDQASEFSLNLTTKYKGTAFEDKDLKLIVSKLVTTDVPNDFELNLEDTETQADVSKVEKDGKLIFLARFKAKLLPKIDEAKVKSQIQGKGVTEAENILKGMENVLGSEIKITPALPKFLQRLPILSQNIKVGVGLK